MMADFAYAVTLKPISNALGLSAKPSSYWLSSHLPLCYSLVHAIALER
jgi:hypothetical protein